MTTNGSPQKKWNEETMSMILGLLMVVVISFIVIRLVDRNRGNIEIPGITLDRQASPTLELNGENQTTPDKEGETSLTATLKPTVTDKPTAKPKPTVAVTPKAQAGTYTVKKGDNLWKIAADQLGDGYRWVEIGRLNNLTNPGLIYGGVKLKLPQVKVAAKEIREENNMPVMGKEYRVSRGDNLWKIAVSAYGDGYQWPMVWRANRQKLPEPGLLEIGMKLTIPTLENEGDGKGVIK